MKPELTADGLPFIIESATAAFSDYVSVQNDVSLRFAGGLATPPFTAAAPHASAKATHAISSVSRTRWGGGALRWCGIGGSLIEVSHRAQWSRRSAM